MKPDLIMWGATGQSIVLAELYDNKYNFLALFDNNEKQPSPHTGVPIYYGKEGLNSWLKTYEKNISSLNYIVAIGGGRGKDRMIIHEQLKQKGLTPISAIHRKAFVANDAQIGEGIQIMANTTVCAKVQLGKCVIINTSSSIDHECVLANGVHVGPGATLSGCVSVGENTFIGAGAVILPNIQIGSNSLIGAGSVVTKNVPSDCIGYGNPLKVKSANIIY